RRAVLALRRRQVRIVRHFVRERVGILDAQAATNDTGVLYAFSALAIAHGPGRIVRTDIVTVDQFGLQLGSIRSAGSALCGRRRESGSTRRRSAARDLLQP